MQVLEEMDTDIDFSPAEAEVAAGPAFSRHETFHPRYGWIKKGFDAAVADPAIFTRDDAPVILGVGKNMVRAIRYWCLAFKVLQTQHGSTAPTPFGHTLLGAGGWDPYMEDPASLWLLHYSLLSDPSLATAWDYAFFHYSRNEFTVGEMEKGMEEFVSREFPNARTASSSLSKDVACIIRMYAGTPRRRSISEESIQCPFADLGLLVEGSTPDRYAFAVGEKPTLATALVAATCLQFAHRIAPAARSISFSRLLREHGSPGMAFKLTEAALYAAIEEVVERRPELTISDAGGVVQLGYTESADSLAISLLDEHYQSVFAKVTA